MTPDEPDIAPPIERTNRSTYTWVVVVSVAGFLLLTECNDWQVNRACEQFCTAQGYQESYWHPGGRYSGPGYCVCDDPTDTDNPKKRLEAGP